MPVDPVTNALAEAEYEKNGEFWRQKYYEDQYDPEDYEIEGLSNFAEKDEIVDFIYDHWNPATQSFF